MHNPYYTQSASIRKIINEQLPNGLETTVDNFTMSLLQHEVTPIRDAIYDARIDGIKELKDHLTEKYGKDENVKANTQAFNFINWLILRLPAKEEMKRYGLIYRN